MVFAIWLTELWCQNIFFLGREIHHARNISSTSLKHDWPQMFALLMKSWKYGCWCRNLFFNKIAVGRASWYGLLFGGRSIWLSLEQLKQLEFKVHRQGNFSFHLFSLVYCFCCYWWVYGHLYEMGHVWVDYILFVGRIKYVRIHFG